MNRDRVNGRRELRVISIGGIQNQGFGVQEAKIQEEIVRDPSTPLRMTEFEAGRLRSEPDWRLNAKSANEARKSRA
jgi:hypothetical protein